MKFTSIVKKGGMALGCAAAMSGCIVSTPARPPEPAPVVEVAPAPPAHGYHWVKGRYVWADNRWVWVKGYWVPD